MKFLIQTSIIMLEKKKFWKIMLQAFVPKSILHVYKKSKWNQRKIAPKIIQNVL